MRIVDSKAGCIYAMDRMRPINNSNYLGLITVTRHCNAIGQLDENATHLWRCRCVLRERPFIVQWPPLLQQLLLPMLLPASA